jgi:hypothetical protein
MYGFIFYGVYRSLKYTSVSKGQDRQIDRRISAVALTSVIIGFNLLTIYVIFVKYFDINILPNNENRKFYLIISFLLIWLYNEIFHKRKLKELSLKHKPIYDKYKYLDKIIGIGVIVVSVIIFMIIGAP